MNPIFLQADHLGLRLEIVSGLSIWEPKPHLKHQRAIDRIRTTIEKAPGADSCGCFHYSDVYIAFPDGSLKRPDIAVFCREPEEEEEAITLIPEAVIEIISKGYEAKDLDIAPRFYASQGVKDTIIFDPYTLLVLHVRRDGTKCHISPITIPLECGCTCQV